MAEVPVRAAVGGGEPVFRVPTGEQLLLAVLDGESALAPYRAAFRRAAPQDHLRALLVQAIDPSLLRVALGPELAAQ